MRSNRRGLTRTYAASDVSKQVSSTIPPPRPPPRKRARPVKKLPPPTSPLSLPQPALPSPEGTSLFTITISSGDTVPLSAEVAVSSDSDETQHPAKKAKANDIDKNGASSQSQKRGGIQVPLRSPRPVRSNRVINPGAPDQPSTRRTSSQVTAEKQRKASLQRGLEALKLREIEILAELELGQALFDEDADRNVVRTLAVVDSDVEMADPIEEFTSSESDGDTDVDEVVALKAPAKIAVC
jgi:hypothetical protein